MLLVLRAGEAHAQAVCVVCNGPDVVYRCQPEGVNLRSGDPRLGLLCITELARAGNHASCSVRRQQQAATCDGPLRTVTISDSPPIAPQPPQQQAIEGTEDGGKRKGPPETVAELAKRTASSSKEQLQNATDLVGDAAKKTGSVVGDAAQKTGSAVGNAAKKSWRCFSLLFKDC